MSQSNTIPKRATQKSARRSAAYLLRCRENVVTMLEALDRNNFEPIVILGHQMGGGGGMFGFPGITDIGHALEEAAENADALASRQRLGELSSYIDHRQGALAKTPADWRGNPKKLL